MFAMRPTTVVSSANFTMVLEAWIEVQSCVKRVKSAGLSTHPCGAPVFRMRADDVLSPILTTCGLLVRKSLIHKHNEVDRPNL